MHRIKTIEKIHIIRIEGRGGAERVEGALSDVRRSVKKEKKRKERTDTDTDTNGQRDRGTEGVYVCGNLRVQEKKGGFKEEKEWKGGGWNTERWEEEEEFVARGRVCLLFS